MVKAIFFASLLFLFSPPGQCISDWLSFKSGKVYVDNGESTRGDAASEFVKDSKSQSFKYMPARQFWKNPFSKLLTNSDDETESNTASDTETGSSEKSITDLENEFLLLEEEAKEAERVALEKRNVADEAFARLEQSRRLQFSQYEERVGGAVGLTQRESNSQHIIDVDDARHLFKTRPKPDPRSVSLAEAKAIKAQIMAEAARKKALSDAKKEAFDAERRMALEESDIPRLEAAKQCFFNEKEEECSVQDGCSWNKAAKVCDVDCNSVSQDRGCVPSAVYTYRRKLNDREINRRQKKCHSIIGIRRKPNFKGKNQTAILNEQYDIERICSFNSATGCCVDRADRFSDRLSG